MPIEFPTIVRRAKLADAQALGEIFYRAVHAIDSAFYSSEQKAAWAPHTEKDNSERWLQRLKQKITYVAQADRRVVGFIELEPGGHIDCFYLLPEFQHKGIGRRLFLQVKADAINLGLSHLSVDASKVAEPLFAKQGFKVIKENVIEKAGQRLENKTMRVSVGLKADLQKRT